VELKEAQAFITRVKGLIEKISIPFTGISLHVYCTHDGTDRYVRLASGEYTWREEGSRVFKLEAERDIEPRMLDGIILDYAYRLVEDAVSERLKRGFLYGGKPHKEQYKQG
jgi:hypothetical protein